MTISPNVPIAEVDESRVAMTGRTIPLAERMRTAVLEVPPEEDLDPEEAVRKMMFEFVLAEFKEKLMYGDEEETGNVTLESDY
jgi:hypothetical protein